MLTGVACARVARSHGWTVIDNVSSGAARAAARQVYDIDIHRQPLHVGLRIDKFNQIGQLASAMAEPSWRRQVVAMLDDSGWQGGVQSSAWQLQFMSKQDLIDRVAKANDHEIARASLPYGATMPPAERDLITTTLVNPSFNDTARFQCCARFRGESAARTVARASRLLPGPRRGCL